MKRSAPGTKGWDVDLGHGVDGEHAVMSALAGKVEVKRDRQACYSGHVVVEFEYKSQPSGIATTTADWWAFVLDGADGRIVGFFIVPVLRLKMLARDAYRVGAIVAGGDDGDSTMVRVKLCDLWGRQSVTFGGTHDEAGVRNRNAALVRRQRPR